MTLRIKSFQSKKKRFTINDAKNICRLKHSWFALEQQQTHFVHICHSVIIIIIWHQGPKVAKRSGKKVQIMSGKKKDGDGEWTEAQRLRLQIPKYISVCRDCMRGIILSGRCAFVVRRFFECLWHNVCVCVCVHAVLATAVEICFPLLVYVWPGAFSAKRLSWQPITIGLSI